VVTIDAGAALTDVFRDFIFVGTTAVTTVKAWGFSERRFERSSRYTESAAKAGAMKSSAITKAELLTMSFMEIASLRYRGYNCHRKTILSAE
jgi:hypothetical protein